MLHNSAFDAAHSCNKIEKTASLSKARNKTAYKFIERQVGRFIHAFLWLKPRSNGKAI